MEKIDIKELYFNKDLKNGQEVLIKGWVRTTRDSKAFGFLEINDGTCHKNAQVVLEASNLKNYSDVVKLNVGSTVYVLGELVLTPENKQPFEIKAKEVTIFQATDETYPIQKKRASVEYLRDIAYLRPRTNLFNAVFRVRSVAAIAIHNYFQENGYLYVNTPLITTTDCEGSDQMFKITTLNFNNLPYDKDGKVDLSKDLFGKQAYITGSGQLHGEAFALAFGKIYTFGPTFRTENSNTKTHANEFWMIEPEIAFCDLDGLMDIEEEMLKYVIKYVLEHCPQEMEFLNNFVQKGLIDKLTKVVNSKFTRIDHKDVITILKEAKVDFEFKPEYGEDIAKEHEKYITEYFGGPVFIKNWPKDIKAYYMKLNPDGETVAAVDLEVPLAGELMGGSQREENYEKIMERCKAMNVDTNAIDWFLNLRKYGSCIHSGFGMGFERLVMYLTGIDNIRDAIPFPRTPNNCEY
ncbi:MAG: asparagine--tRNA ligase [Candidatus Onthovivens sp.]|nr:asparagine--tRNA ligase [Candidatus Onthovivens sp.]